MESFTDVLIPFSQEGNPLLGFSSFERFADWARHFQVPSFLLRSFPLSRLPVTFEIGFSPEVFPCTSQSFLFQDRKLQQFLSRGTFCEEGLRFEFYFLFFLFLSDRYLPDIPVLQNLRPFCFFPLLAVTPPSTPLSPLFQMRPSPIPLLGDGKAKALKGSLSPPLWYQAALCIKNLSQRSPSSCLCHRIRNGILSSMPGTHLLSKLTLRGTVICFSELSSFPSYPLLLAEP